MIHEIQVCLENKHRIVGQQFGKLLVLCETSERSQRGEVLYECQCLCGKLKLTTKRRLLDKRVISCGCAHREKAIEMCKSRFKDLSGMTFGRLKVIHRSEEINQEHPLYICWCSCGQVSKVKGSNLKNGTTQSCGCLQKKMASIRMKKLNKIKKKR